MQTLNGLDLIFLFFAKISSCCTQFHLVEIFIDSQYLIYIRWVHLEYGSESL